MTQILRNISGQMKKRIRTSGLLFLASAMLVTAGYFAFGQDGNKPETIQAVQQPPSALEVASSLHCVSFVDNGPALGGGVIDSGNCWIGGQKYAIDTFASEDARDAWLVSAERLGVNPKWQTSTAVIYPSVSADR